LRKIAVILTTFTLAAVLTGAATPGVPQSAVKTGTANEQSPAVTTGWFAWTQSSADHPNRTNVRAEAMPVDGASVFQVNDPGTRAWTGGIEGSQLVYQQIDSGDSDIRLHDLATNQPVANPPINTNLWEWHPSISTDTTGDRWIMFGRQNTSTWTQRIFAYNTSDDVMVELAETTNRRDSLIPGQLNGDWATWTACRPNCQVRYVNLLDGLPATKVPRPSNVRHQYGSSIAEDGTVYFVRSGRGCGANVRVMRRSAGDTDRVIDLPNRRDIFFTYTADGLGGGNHVFYDRVACGSGAWNIYKFID
jgi:hypothetical protein